MRLLFVSQDFPPDVGGTQTFTMELARRLAPRCDFFAVLAPRRAGSDAVDAGLRFPVYRLPARPDLLPLAALPVLPVLARRHRLDATLHTQWPTAAAALVARGLSGYPRHILTAAHGRELLLDPWARSGLSQVYPHLRRAVFTHVDGCFPVSHYTAGLLAQMGAAPERLMVLPNGVDPERFFPQDASALRKTLGIEDRPVLLTVGRLVPRKGIDTVLHALPGLISEFPRLRYLVAGDGPDRGRLEGLTAARGVQGHVRFLGKVSYEALPLYYNACDVFVMPSRAAPPDVEGFGLVFLEANACGKPVVGARTGGIPDAVHHGETGLLVPPDDTDALAGALAQLLRDPYKAAMLGRNGRNYVLREGTWDHVAERLYTCLAHDIARGGGKNG